MYDLMIMMLLKSKSGYVKKKEENLGRYPTSMQSDPLDVENARTMTIMCNSHD